MYCELCIRKDAIKESPSVQKDVALEDLLLNETAFVDFENNVVWVEHDSWNVESNPLDKWLPLTFSTLIRSVYTNKVLYYVDENFDLCLYTDMCGVPGIVHKGYDLVMYLASQSIWNFVDASNIEVQKIMADCSTFQCLGLHYDQGANPTVLSQITVTDDGFSSLCRHLICGAGAMDIADAKRHKIFGSVPVFEELIEVKLK